MRVSEIREKRIRVNQGLGVPDNCTHHCTEVRLVSFLSGGFITAIVVSSQENKLAKRTYVHCTALLVFHCS